MRHARRSSTETRGRWRVRPWRAASEHASRIRTWCAFSAVFWRSQRMRRSRLRRSPMEHRGFLRPGSRLAGRVHGVRADARTLGAPPACIRLDAPLGDTRRTRLRADRCFGSADSPCLLRNRAIRDRGVAQQFPTSGNALLPDNGVRTDVSVVRRSRSRVRLKGRLDVEMSSMQKTTSRTEVPVLTQWGRMPSVSLRFGGAVRLEFCMTRSHVAGGCTTVRVRRLQSHDRATSGRRSHSLAEARSSARPAANAVPDLQLRHP